MTDLSISLGIHTRQEIFSQPEAWRGVLSTLDAEQQGVRAFYHSARFDQVVFIGCGSTYYLSLAAAAALQRLAGVRACGLPASEVWRNPFALPPAERTLLVAVSRSGETTETLRACETFRRNARGAILTLSCYPGRALTELGDLNLVFPSVQEESVAQTRAFTGLYLAALTLTALWAGDAALLDELRRLPDALAPLLAKYGPTLEQLGADLSMDRFYFLGSGLRYGLACELSLKMKEMTLSHSEPFYFMEFRHGPKSMITPTALVVGLVSEERRDDDLAVLAEMAALGGRTLSIGARQVDVAFGSAFGAIAGAPLYLPFGQILALGRSLAKGLNPDRPEHLDAVVVLE
ncbi:MAG: SIS domain-containing protein [Caldilinea sp.]|nr:SIS domain-containing protein [Caldilinea sp.]MDW8439424.1 SIS domain-containing protein [Caldilineaceae bacterium]